MSPEIHTCRRSSSQCLYPTQPRSRAHAWSRERSNNHRWLVPTQPRPKVREKDRASARDEGGSEGNPEIRTCRRSSCRCWYPTRPKSRVLEMDRASAKDGGGWEVSLEIHICRHSSFRGWYPTQPRSRAHAWSRERNNNHRWLVPTQPKSEVRGRDRASARDEGGSEGNPEIRTYRRSSSQCWYPTRPRFRVRA